MKATPLFNIKKKNFATTALGRRGRKSSTRSSLVGVRNTTKGKLPSLPFLNMKDAVLGKDYELSFTIVGKQKIRSLNRIYRELDKPTDILSFPLTKKSGEIFICLPEVKSHAKLHGRTPNNYLGFLFIHGLLHLRGLDHGSRMEQEEKKFASVFNI